LSVRPLQTILALTIALSLLACDPGEARKPGAAATQPAPPPRVLIVFAAASLTESFKELGHRYESVHPAVTVRFNFGGSQQLRAQLEQGAPADVFASANTKEMDAASRAGVIDAGTVRTFARNRLVVIVPTDNRAKVDSLADLKRPGVKIVVADPAVPVGGYTMRMLDAMSDDPTYGPSYKSAFLGNIVSREENVKSVVGKVRLGEADAGVVYVTDAAAPRDGGQPALRSIPVPDRHNQLADYPIAVAARAAQPDLARAFVDLAVAEEGRRLLAGYGFLPAAAPK
jgi:molybdate transport system substrate-binding protein